MPNFDTGHLFLTFLSPIKSGATKDDFGVTVSHEQAIRESLSLLPTALQSPATVEIAENSPFARNKQTHLCRFVVIEDAVYNGRNPQDPIITSLRGKDPINPRPVDKLNCGYLLFAADVDAVMKEGDSLPATLDADAQDRARDAYAHRLWETMEQELRSIYEHCVGFDSVNSGEDFARYIARCQIDTTMPFNDYWISAPDIKNLPTKVLGAVVLVPLVLCLLGLLGLLLGWETTGLFWIGGIVTAIAAYFAYRYVIDNGQKPMPPARYGDLPSVLKSLYLQQTFADFAIDAQGKSAEDLHAAFGDYLDAHRPGDKMAPAQAPGVISIEAENGIAR